MAKVAWERSLGSEAEALFHCRLPALCQNWASLVKDCVFLVAGDFACLEVTAGYRQGWRLLVYH